MLEIVLDARHATLALADRRDLHGMGARRGGLADQLRADADRVGFVVVVDVERAIPGIEYRQSGDFRHRLAVTPSDDPGELAARLLG